MNACQSRGLGRLAKGKLGQGRSLVQTPWLLISQTLEFLSARRIRGAINPFGRKTKLNISLILQFKKTASFLKPSLRYWRESRDVMWERRGHKGRPTIIYRAPNYFMPLIPINPVSQRRRRAVIPTLTPFHSEGRTELRDVKCFAQGDREAAGKNHSFFVQQVESPFPTKR